MHSFSWEDEKKSKDANQDRMDSFQHATSEPLLSSINRVDALLSHKPITPASFINFLKRPQKKQMKNGLFSAGILNRNRLSNFTHFGSR